MNKTFRIFAKDTRHLWPEILLSLALVVSFAATGHIGWPQFQPDPFREAKVLQLWIEVLMPISWWLLVSRAIHDESLVGDRQFWITRPYGWPRVLAAKLIFITVYILLPYLLAQCFLLHQAHLHPFAVLPGLAFTLLMVFGFFLLPLIALSAVTATVTRIFLIFFALAVYAGLVAYLASTFLTAAEWVPGGEPRYPSILFMLIPVVALSATLLQYARRRTAVSVTLLVALVVITTAACIAAYNAPHRLGDFPALATGEQSPIAIAFNPDPKFQTPLDEAPKTQTKSDSLMENPVEIPIIFSGIARGRAVTLDAKTFTISAPGKKTRTVPWSRSNNGMFNWHSAQPRTSSEVDNTDAVLIPRWIYSEFAGEMVTLHVTYAVTELEAESPINVPFDGHFAEVPQHGYCSKVNQINGLICQYALTGPSFAHVAWNLKDACGVPSTGSLSKETWIGDPDPGIRQLDFNPVVTSWSDFSAKEIVRKTSHTYSLCPGDSLTFTKYHITRKRLLDVTIPSVDLRLYLKHPYYVQSTIDADPPAPGADSE